MSTTPLQNNHMEELTMPEAANHHCFYYFDLLPGKNLLSIMPGKVWKVLRESMPAPQHVPRHSDSIEVLPWATKPTLTHE